MSKKIISIALVLIMCLALVPMTALAADELTATPTASTVLVNGETVAFDAYNIGGNNYFKLRDIGQAFDFGVDWDGAKNTIVIDTGKGYAAEGQTPVTPPATTEPPKTDPPTSGENSQKLIGTWSSGGGTQQIRKILSGKYDIRAISFGSSIIPGMSYTFNEDGTYMFILLDNYSLLIVEGKYSLSNGKLTLTSNTGKTTSKNNVPIVWESTTKPADETHSIDFGVSEIWGWDMLYLDGEEVGYSRSEEV